MRYDANDSAFRIFYSTHKKTLRGPRAEKVVQSLSATFGRQSRHLFSPNLKSNRRRRFDCEVTDAEGVPTWHRADALFLPWIENLLKGAAGLPNVIYSNQESKNELILEGLGMEEIGIFYSHLK
jgi:hypothetical protein